MPKALCILGMVIALLLGVFFLADLAVLRLASGGMSGTMNIIMDVGFSSRGDPRLYQLVHLARADVKAGLGIGDWNSIPNP